jgi:hypothetical protein
MQPSSARALSKNRKRLARLEEQILSRAASALNPDANYLDGPTHERKFAATRPKWSAHCAKWFWSLPKALLFGSNTCEGRTSGEFGWVLNSTL